MSVIEAAGESLQHDHDSDFHLHEDGTWHSHPYGQVVPHQHGGDDVNVHFHHAQRLDHQLLQHGDPLNDDHGNVAHFLDVETRVLAKNDALAAKVRAWYLGREILALNLLSSPGSGKTTLLERTISSFAGELSLFVIEGDQATANDGERIRAAGAPVVQVNTGSGCHLDAEMVVRGLAELRPGPGAVVCIENVGNLVCPSLFDLGERSKIVIFAVTEGEDKPIKYPGVFRAAEIVLLNKIDLLPHLEFSLTQAIANVRQVNPHVPILEISARTGEGLENWYDWIRKQFVAFRAWPYLTDIGAPRRHR